MVFSLRLPSTSWWTPNSAISANLPSSSSSFFTSVVLYFFTFSWNESQLTQLGPHSSNINFALLLHSPFIAQYEQSSLLLRHLRWGFFCKFLMWSIVASITAKTSAAESPSTFWATPNFAISVSGSPPSSASITPSSASIISIFSCSTSPSNCSQSESHMRQLGAQFFFMKEQFSSHSSIPAQTAQFLSRFEHPFNASGLDLLNLRMYSSVLFITSKALL